MPELLGVSLEKLQDPIRSSLAAYHNMSDETVEFDLDAACRLELTPDKANSARTATPVKYLGKVAATLYVIAFGPQDGTGDESGYKLEDQDTGNYPHATKVVPRKKVGTHSETHLTIATSKLDTPNDDPVLFAGNLDLLGGGFGKVRKIAELGQPTDDFESALLGEAVATPTSTLTVGYRGTIDRQDGPGMWSYWRRRFGDPHAVYNPRDVIQVCGFIGIPSENSVDEDLNLLRALESQDPQLIQSL